MAKKTTSRAKAEPKPESPAAAAPAKPRASAKAPKPETSKVVASKGRKATPVNEPTDEEIRVRAFEIYIERGGGHGSDLDDWLAARQDLLGRK
jgi:hypothetical protein